MATSSLLSLPHSSASFATHLYSLHSSFLSHRYHTSPALFISPRASSGDSAPNGASKQIEIVYDPRSKFEQLAGELVNPRRNITLFSPCKINIFLRITNKRPDGYHDLASLFHVVSLGDILKFSVSPSTTKDSLTTNARGIPLDDRNLIIKALNLFRKKTGSNTYFWIHLDKKVPTGAGLGGGSGNAATALWAANHLSGNLVGEKELQEWSGEIGSDIPFFFSKGAAYCTGRGEIVEDIPPLSLDIPMVLIKPKEECSTAEVYKHFRLDQASSADPRKLLQEIMSRGISQDLCINDLEPPAFNVLPSLKALKERIAATSRGRYQAVFMSGSGSTIVGVGDSEAPQFIYEEDEYQEVFTSDVFFLRRKENEWYQKVISECSIEFGEIGASEACR
ncbi:hypothetical protein GOP47_0005326 [Adiantum capillus-veneris]|uniref:4-(cytidine 5'-diphospho)-2-C-methyl-D-erythritol kinase n=1 Tax=Adiantum capillus-veneris TaxID=13818 RepID=A0A9D4V5L8_ADICA|nr:hypothetical protein GOP47_0005326 [Adiantum capillus-veneris]